MIYYWDCAYRNVNKVISPWSSYKCLDKTSCLKVHPSAQEWPRLTSNDYGPNTSENASKHYTEFFIT